ncbi:MAG: A/G-specific adenine glycosylase [Candidatus Magasanikbacteria bacterium]
MLQQTQVKRVAEKFPQFIKAFPNFKSLAQASLTEILRAWQGMGYNRRALFLKKIAEIVIRDYKGKLSDNDETLKKLPGIGPNTAASICAFAFNKPTIFIETNIRSVFIHEFFSDKKIISDKDIFPLVEQTMDIRNPREWYSALMDYGTMIKSTHGNPNIKSRHYARQSAFKGSNREIRGSILKLLTNHNTLTKGQIIKKLGDDPARIQKILQQLSDEDMIFNFNSTYSLEK